MLDVFLGFFFLASGITANKKILAWLPSMLFVGIRMIIPGLILFFLVALRHKKIEWKKIIQHLPTIILCAFFTTFIPSNLKAYALKNLISSKQAFLGSLEPFFAAIYGYFLFREKITLRKIIGLVLGFIGIMFLLASTSPIEETIGTIWIFSYPELAMLAAVAISRFGWALVQKVLKAEYFRPTEFNSYLMITSGLLSLASAFFHESIYDVSFSHPYTLLGLMTYTIVAGNLIGYNLYAHALKRYSTTFIALSGFSVPIWVYLFGYIFLNEPMSINFFISISITLCGLYIFYQDEL